MDVKKKQKKIRTKRETEARETKEGMVDGAERIGVKSRRARSFLRNRSNRKTLRDDFSPGGA